MSDRLKTREECLTDLTNVLEDYIKAISREANVDVEEAKEVVVHVCESIVHELKIKDLLKL